MLKPPDTAPQRRTTSKLPSTRWVLLATLILVALAGPASAATLHPASHRWPARTAHTLNATDTAHLHYTHASGSLLYEEGTATGTLPGTMRAHVDIGPTTTGTFTFYVRGGGTISGHGNALMHGSGVYESFGGTLVVTGGTGRYTHAHGRAGLYGTFDRKNYALLVQTTGRLAY
jgi:hypothetical protein